MGGRTRILVGAGLVGAGGVGAGLALGAASLAGGLGGETVTVREIRAFSPAASVSPRPLSINDIYRRAAPGVVQVTSTAPRRSLGSGFVVDKAGHVVTTYDVIKGAKHVRVAFSNGSSTKTTVVGTDPSSGLAVLEIEASPRALTPLPLGNSDAVAVGDQVVAIGNPFGLDRTVTGGIVSAIQSAITAPNGYTIDHVIQTDAAVDRGNSGGPLLDREGEVIGVTSHVSGADSSVGLGFAVPARTVKTVIAQLIRRGRIDRAFLGVGAVAITRELARVFRLPVSRGLIVQSVQPGSGAAEAGLKAGTTQVVLAGESYDLGGDIVVRAAGKPVTSLNQLRDVIAAKRPGDSLRLVISRDGEWKNLDVRLGRQPAVRTG